MAEEEGTQSTLRETISSLVDQAETLPPEQPPEVAAPEPDLALSEAQKAERARDEQGRFVAQEKQKQQAAAPEVKPAPSPAPVQLVVAEVPTVKYPSGAKPGWANNKAIADVWSKVEKAQPLTLDEAQKLTDWMHQREGQFANGVSTYKKEWDQAKPYLDAITPILPVLQQNGRDFREWVGTMAGVHKTFAFGSPQEKVNATLQLLQDYNVPLLQYLQQGGQLPQFNPNIPQQRAPQPQQQDVRAVVQDMLMQQTAQQQLAEFERDAPTKYPHYEAVKETMARLLESGFSTTYPEAYEDALRQRSHADLYAQAQQAKVDSEKAEAERQRQEAAARARRNTVSVRSATPAAKGGDGRPRTVRESVLEAVDQHVDSGRV